MPSANGPSRRAEATQKWQRMRRAIEHGQAAGTIHGPPVLGPTIGAIRGYVRCVRTMLKEDLSS